ncbi:uncharacterized protein Dwil_GK19786 [Drosophila willistoni]|uniref:DUF4794 domain-containing protein n=1 Tax=Drosophila willistoni TaxID=7260 RepID=B4MT30_DROWI|nr:uncharacterized protein LOC6641172 [Drosophila willistoni]EDW75269.1 uncharacterized protein Dwil_GK19786 [Drosophila willistoni]
MSSFQIWAILLPMVVTLILAKALPIEPESESSTPLEMERQRIDCKLTFDAMTMDSLVQPNSECTGLSTEAPQPEHEEKGKVESVTNKPESENDKNEPEIQTEREQRSLMSSMDSQPIYELQLVVWPTDDIEDGDDFNPPLTTTTTRRTPITTTTRNPRRPTIRTSTMKTPSTSFTSTVPPSPRPPAMDFEEENLDNFYDELPPTATISPPPPPPPAAADTSHPWPTESNIYVVEDYHVVHPNGTTVYKIVLSNGFVNYKKIYTKIGKDDEVINVQKGYYTIPIPGLKNQFRTHYYIADERGYNVYKIVQSYHQPERDNNLHYKAKN